MQACGQVAGIDVTAVVRTCSMQEAAGLGGRVGKVWGLGFRV